MKSISKVAVLIVVHNRFEMTKACINALIGQGIRPNMIVLVDDGSTDGTGSKARSAFPGIHLVRGDGSLYWCGAMAIAEAYANEHIDFEFLLWVNNDVALADSALSDLLSVASEHPGAIVAGSMVSSINHSVITYSGFRRNRPRFGFTRYSRIESVADAPVAVDTFNGNLVLVPKNVAARLGGVERRFIQHYGDLDYGFRATSGSIPVWVAPGVQGVTDRNALSGTFRDRGIARSLRLKNLFGPKGFPLSSRFLFLRRHGGILWPFEWAGFYVYWCMRVLIGR